MESTELKQEASVVQSQQAAPAKPDKQIKPPKKKRKWPKRLITLIILALAAFFLFKQCTGGGPAALTGTYIPDTAQIRDMTISVSGTGTIQPIDSYKVTALVKGEILSAPFEEGDVVEKDAPLFQIDTGDVENNIARARLTVEQAQLAYDQLLRNQKDTQLTANASGVIQDLPFDAGDNVTAGSVVATILDNSTMKLTVPFHSSDAASFFIGQAASVAVDGTTELLSGTVDEIAATDSVGLGGTLVRSVTIKVPNPGALDVTSTGTATVNGATCSASGGFDYAANKQVVAKTSGELSTLYVKKGDPVTDGQVIGAFDGDTISDQIENARLSLRSAQLSLQSAQDALDDYTITAPISGTIIEKNYKAGDNVDPSTAAASGASTYMAVIYDMTTLTFDMSINELDIGKIQVGQTVEVCADPLDGKTFTGYVDKVNINGTTSNGKTTYPVTVKLDGNGSELQKAGLYPGMNISAKVIVEEVPSALSIPVDYVARGNTVLVALPGAMDENGNVIDRSKIETRPVTLGRSNDEYIEILEGLQENDTVLYENHASSAMAMMMGG